MRYSSSSTKVLMQIPHLYLQLQQLRQWIKPKDKRHLQGFAEAVAAILQSGSASLSHWLPYLSYRGCQARSQMERLSYFVHNPHIIAETFYNPAEVLSASICRSLVRTNPRYEYAVG
jgi:hypothetical protein